MGWKGGGGVKGFLKYKITRDSSAIKFERGELAEHLFLVLFHWLKALTSIKL